MKKSFKRLKNKLSPESQKRIEEKVEALVVEMSLAERLRASKFDHQEVSERTNRDDLDKKKET